MTAFYILKRWGRKGLLGLSEWACMLRKRGQLGAGEAGKRWSLGRHQHLRKQGAEAGGCTEGAGLAKHLPGALGALEESLSTKAVL